VTTLSGLDADQRRRAVEGRIRDLVTQVLRVDPAVVSAATPFKSLGLDSLLSLELRNRLETAFAQRLSPTLLWTYGTVDALATAMSDMTITTGDRDE
jgi:phthiocerol/phenolphthiocerol synthesis type-I polyketide synthase C